VISLTLDLGWEGFASYFSSAVEFAIKIQAYWFRTAVQTSAMIVLLAGSALLLACGSSSGPAESTLTPPPASSHTVDLSWQTSTSRDISGYNIYRAPYSDSCGEFTRINSALDTGTSYTDSTVANGTSYCYAITAVSTSNAESGYSNIVSNIQIPAN